MSCSSRLMAIGAALLAASMLMFCLLNAELLAWILMTASFPLIMEAVAWGQAEQFAGMRYDLYPDSLRGAYKVSSAVPRLIFLYLWLFAILTARELQLLPDNGWVAVIILAPFALWLALTYRSYSNIIIAYMEERGSAGTEQ
ncbi:MAG: hypothetical protein K2X59_06870 [Sphingomonas sp.]|nr:hypothetical protein [Sphingomonas sp.]